MNNFTDYFIVWVLFIGASVVLGIFYTKRMRKMKQLRKKQEEVFNQTKEEYSTISPEKFDNIEFDNYVEAIYCHILAKEEKFDESGSDGEFIDVLTHGEKLIYTIFQMQNAINSTRNGSLHSFFIDQPYCQYVPYSIEILEALEMKETAVLMESAKHLADVIASDNEEEDEDDGDYSTYNFSDFTNELLTQFQSSNVKDKMNKYISEHKEDFIDKE